MIIKLNRIHTTKNTTIGTLKIDGDLICRTLEDTYREKKIPGQTRIPKGEYDVNLRFIGGMYEQYSKRFENAHPMLWIRDIPGFEYIYFHILNYHTETEGCVGVGRDFDTDKNGDYFLIGSESAYQEMYPIVRKALENGEKVTVRIKDRIMFDGAKIKKEKIKYEIPALGDLKTHKDQRQAVVSTLERLWFELDGKSVAFGTVNFITKRLTGYGFFKDRLNLNKDQSIFGRLLELINTIITKLKGTKS